MTVGAAGHADFPCSLAEACDIVVAADYRHVQPALAIGRTTRPSNRIRGVVHCYVIKTKNIVILTIIIIVTIIIKPVGPAPAMVLDPWPPVSGSWPLLYGV